uniref:Ubiquitin carboxyl-terminal hydrolase n=1 Tax=Clastoptera arizonana TaxID=38151 RepID=A0A1B6D745_9HEMI
MNDNDESVLAEVLWFPNEIAITVLNWVFRVFYIVLFGSVLCFFGLGVLSAADNSPIVSIYLESSVKRVPLNHVNCSKFQKYQINGTSGGIKTRTVQSQEAKGLIGLKNIGNTCFLNSVVQCLSNTKLLMEYITSKQYLNDIRLDTKGSLMKAFGDLIQNIWQSSSSCALNTGSFKNQVQRYAPRFDGYLQHDAQEFLRYLLEGLHEDINRVTTKQKMVLPDISDDLTDNQKAQESWKRYLRIDNSKIVDIFVGQLKSTLQCTTCKHCSTTFEAFWDLSLSLPKTSGEISLSQCLELFTSEEILDGDEMPTCSKCKCRRKCKKRFLIHKFPQVLVLHLKRFSPSERYRKISVAVDFPVNALDMSQYAAQSHTKAEYNLYAVANHNGTASSGHYTAYCKHPQTAQWHHYNDTWVTTQSVNDLVSASGYVLFYEQISSTRL